MSQHFEELWTECENVYLAPSNCGALSGLLEELVLKVNLYRAIDQKIELPPSELQNMKSRTMGEILLTLTGISAKDNINVFEALSVAQQFHSIEHYSKKYQ